jgi:putative addiction module CopG family antidote
MSIELAPELQAFVDEEVRLGNYPDAESVVRAALMRLRDDQGELDDELLDSIEQSKRDVEAGRFMEWADAEAELRRRHGLA